MEQQDNQKSSYLKGLQLLFQDFIKPKTADQNHLQTLTNAMFDWYFSLPQITLTFQETDSILPNDLRLMKELRKVIWKENRDPEEVLFQNIPKSMEAQGDLDFCLRQITRTKRQMELHVRRVKQKAAERVRRIFKGRSQEDLQQCLKSWFFMLHYQEDTIFSLPAQMLIQLITNTWIHDEETIVSRIAKIVTDHYVEDWENGSLNRFTVNLRELKEEIEAKQGGLLEEREIIFTGTNGKWIRWYFSTPKDTKQNHNFRNLVENVIQTQGDGIQVREQIAILIGEIEQMLQRLRDQDLKKEQLEE